MGIVRSFLNDLEIIHSGNAHLIVGDKLKFDFDLLKIEIRFEDNESIGEGKVKYTIVNGVLEIVFQNYKNTQKGGGILTPWKIGTLEGKELFLTLYIKFLDYRTPGLHACSYVFYTGKEVVNEE